MAKKKTYRKFAVIKDTREKTGWKFRASANCSGMVTRKLDTGDYSISGYEDLIMIERKSISDLWNSLLNGRERFLREMERAKEIPLRYLIIEGTMKDINAGIRYSKVKADFIIASLVSLEVKYGIHVIFASKRKDVCQTYVRKLLLKLFQYCEDGIVKKNERPSYTK